jgi:PTH1 family peptidyl-tRNA hydrolase
MKLVVGLGNIGQEYENTRHNVGFEALDFFIVNQCGALVEFQKFSKKSHIQKINFQQQQLILCKPQTYMNLSGHSVVELLSYFKITPNNLIVVHDELDIPLGSIKTKLGGGDAGHNGLKSITALIGPNYHRVRIGIGRPNHPQTDISQFVLSPFTTQERPILQPTLQNTSAAIVQAIAR